MYFPARADRSMHEIEVEEAPLVVHVDAEKTINFVSSATYLGHVVTTDLLDNKHLQSRVSKASQVFGALGKDVFRNKKVWKSVKSKVLLSMIIPVLLDGVECCAVSAKMMAEMETSFHRFVRSCLHVTPFTQRQSRFTSENLLRKLGLQPLHYYMDLKILAYAGHVSRMPEYRMPKITTYGKLVENRRLGRPVKNVLAVLNESLKRKGILGSTWKLKAADKLKWRSTIRRTSKLRRARVKNKTFHSPSWVANPQRVIGFCVEKQFGTKWYVGTVVQTLFDEDNQEQLWSVKYDDDENELYDAGELDKILSADPVFLR
jgi:hypothetical protein